MTCPACGLALPVEARFCARCGTPLPVAGQPARRESAPVWVMVLLWLGAGGLLWIAAIYTAFALGAIPAGAVPQGADLASLRGASALVAACAASLFAGHLAAAIGLTTGRPWARTFATMVCVVWGLTCVGLPVAILAISALWRRSRSQRPVGPAAPRPSA